MSLSDELMADFEDEGMAMDGEDMKPTLSAIPEEDEMEVGDGLNLKGTVREVAKLYGSQRLTNIMEKIKDFSKQERKTVSGAVELDPEYPILVEANAITVELENEIGIIHKFVKDLYLPRYPELDSLITQPLDFIKTVKILGNDILENSKLNDELAEFLQSATIMVLSVTASTTAGVKLEADVMSRVFEACEVAIETTEMKLVILRYVESRMNFIAPNLSVICGASTAAKLMGAVGGLTNLVKMPACNILLIGSQKKTLQGMSRASVIPHTGLIYYSEFVQSLPPDLRRKAANLIANKATLASRVDYSHSCPEGTVGQDMLADIEGKLEKLQEPPPVKSVKALPAPIEQSKKKRGGRRARKMKERLGITDMRKMANRMNFGDIEDEAYQEDLGFSLGTLGKKQSGKLRGPGIDSKTKAKVSKTLQQKLNKQQTWGGSTTIKKQISGTASVAFTPMQGLEIVNPGAAEQKIREANEKYFSSTAGFNSVKK